jgi:hypothetical protein
VGSYSISGAKLLYKSWGARKRKSSPQKLNAHLYLGVAITETLFSPTKML